MSFSSQLTDLYHILKNSNGSLDHVYTKDFEVYLQSLTLEKFIDSVFVYGTEVRDETLGTMDSEISKLINLIQNIYETKFKEDIDSDDKLKSIYNIGIINMYLYFCERDQIQPHSYQTEELKNYIAKNNPSKLDQIKTLDKVDINRSVDYLRKATSLASETIDIAKGIYFYHVMRIFDYIFSIFENYRVDNDNKPIDLDSFYIFSDQLDSNDLWNELARQIKLKYNYQDN